MPIPSPKESIILSLLSDQGPLYGLELVNLSDERLKRGTVYVTLSRMVDKGLVRIVDDCEPETHTGLPRPKYRITAAGERSLLAHQTVVGLLRPARGTP